MGVKILKASLPVRQAHFATDKAHALLVLSNGAIEVVELASGTKTREWSPKGIRPPYIMQREGNWVVGRGEAGELRGAHVPHDTTEFGTKALPMAIGNVALAPRGKFMAVAFTDERCVRFYDMTTGEQTAEFADGVGGSSFIGISPDEHFLVLAAFDASLRVYSLPSKKLVMQYDGLPMAVWAGAFAADSRSLFLGSTDAKLYRIKHGVNEPEILAKGLPANINHLAMLGDGSVVSLESNPAGNSLPVVARHWSGAKMESRVIADLPKTASHLDAHPGGGKSILVSDGTRDVRFIEFG
jgi:WD40 repeat protein